MIVFFAANGMAMMALTMLGTINVGGGDAGLASGLITSSKQIGAAIWLAVLTVAASHAPGSGRAAIRRGFALGFWLASGLSVLAAGLVLGLLRHTDSASVHAAAEVPPETAPRMV
jgi:hypothetical protein